MVVENAADARDLELLLPATPGSAAIVTSRRLLPSLDADLALPLGKLDLEAAVAWLADAATTESTAASQDEPTRLASLCGCFPLALKIACAMLRNGAVESVSALNAMLANAATRIDAFALESMELRPVVDQAYRPSRAIPLLESAAAGFDEAGDGRWLAFTLGDLGKAYRLVARRDAAEASLVQSISLLEELGEPRWSAVTRLRYADLLRVSGDTNGAAAMYRDAFDTFNSLADPLWAARALTGLSLVEAREGVVESAVSNLKDALSTFRRFGYEVDACWALVSLYRAQLARRPGAANEALNEARKVAARLGRDASYVQRLIDDSGPDVR